jgi:hypothetical protein
MPSTSALAGRSSLKLRRTSLVVGSFAGWDYDWRNKRFQRDDNTRFNVNLVVYALGA